MVLEVVERRRRRGNGLAGKGGLAHLTGAGQQRHRSMGYGLVQVLGVNRPVYQRHPASLSLKIHHVMHDLAGSSVGVTGRSTGHRDNPMGAMGL